MLYQTNIKFTALILVPELFINYNENQNIISMTKSIHLLTPVEKAAIQTGTTKVQSCLLGCTAV
jgi:hypothetical protein